MSGPTNSVTLDGVRLAANPITVRDDSLQLYHSAHLERLRTHQLRLARFRPVTMDRCHCAECHSIPEHNRVAHQQPEFPASLYGDQGGNPTLAPGIDATPFFHGSMYTTMPPTKGSSLPCVESSWAGLTPSTLINMPYCPNGVPQSLPPAFADPITLEIPRKIDNSPSMVSSACRILASEVDPSEYEAIDNEELSKSESRSEATIDTDSDDPSTPQDGVDSFSFGEDVERKFRSSILAGPAFGTSASFPGSQMAPQISIGNVGQAIMPGISPNGRMFGALDETGPSWQDEWVWSPKSSNVPQDGILDGGMHGLPNTYVPADHFVRPNLLAPQPIAGAQALALQLTGNDVESTPNVAEPAYSSGSVGSEGDFRRERDDFLLRCRRRGMSYKDIKRRGRFSEAESTLRGRIRILTKDKSERVRRPAWDANDVCEGFM